MGKIILLSSKVVWNAATAGPHPGIVDAINAVAAAGSHVALISRHGEPPWFKQLFPTKTAHIFHASGVRLYEVRAVVPVGPASRPLVA